jgi:hypothetical protein
VSGYSPRLAKLARLRKSDLLARYLLLVKPTDGRTADRSLVGTDLFHAAGMSREQLIARLLEAA